MIDDEKSGKDQIGVGRLLEVYEGFIALREGNHGAADSLLANSPNQLFGMRRRPSDPPKESKTEDRKDEKQGGG